MNVHAAPTHDLIVVGGGPRAISLVERLCARAPGSEIRVLLIDRFEVGAGATWRTDQTPHFLNNTYAAHTTIYTDESTPMDGPLTPGPDLLQWAAAVVAGQPQVRAEEERGWRAPVRPRWAACEAAELRPWSYPTRRLQGVYYREQLEAILKRAKVRLEGIRGTAVDLRVDGDLRSVHLADGSTYRAPVVVLAQGMVQARPSERVKEFRSAARAHGLVYVAPGMPAERDWSAVPEGEAVLTAGLGANFFDIITLLTEGRGGVFTQRSGPFDLEYTPSGREPRLIAGSRRGLPYRSKSYYGALPPPYRPQLATDAWFAQVGQVGRLDFARDLWPVFLREFTIAHLATLARSRPEALPGVRAQTLPPGWRDPATAPLDEEVLALVQQTPPERLAGVVSDLIADGRYRFDPERLDRPDLRPRERWEAWVARWVAAERESITDPFRSPRASVNRAMARLRRRLGRLVRDGAIDPVSESRDINGWFDGVSLALASGPPPERTARLLALVEAGVVELLGEGSEFSAEEGRFVGYSPVHPPVRSRALIETRMSKGNVDVTDDPLIRALRSRGAARLHTKASASGQRQTTRTLDVTQEGFALIGEDGRADERVRVLGIPAGDVQRGSSIGATPGVPSPLLAGADAVAGEVLGLIRDRSPAGRG